MPAKVNIGEACSHPFAVYRFGKPFGTIAMLP